MESLLLPLPHYLCSVFALRSQFVPSGFKDVLLQNFAVSHFLEKAMALILTHSLLQFGLLIIYQVVHSLCSPDNAHFVILETVFHLINVKTSSCNHNKIILATELFAQSTRKSICKNSYFASLKMCPYLLLRRLKSTFRNFFSLHFLWGQNPGTD